MKKITFLLSTALFFANTLFAQVTDLYIRFNLVPEGSGLLTGAQSPTKAVGEPIAFDESNNPTSAYLMDAPEEATGIYTKTLNLPAGNYEYQVVKADGLGEQNTGLTYPWTLGRPFTVTEQKDVTFRAKLDNGYRRFLCTEQYSNIRISPWTTGTASTLFNAPDEEGIAHVFVNGPKAGTILEGVLFSGPADTNYSIADLMPYTGSKKNFSSSRGVVRWVLAYNVNTLSFADTAYHKLVTLLKNDSISSGAEYSLASASSSLGTFSTTTPLNLKGSTTSVSVRTTLTTDANSTSLGYTTALHSAHLIAPKNIEAKMFYQILNASSNVISEGNQTLTTDDVETGAYETIWKSATPMNITNGLGNGDYSLKIWYQTVCFSDTITSTVNTTSFSVDNTTTDVISQNNNVRIFTSNNTINVKFDGVADVKLYSISGLLIDNAYSLDKLYTKQVEKGMYIIKLNDKTYKIAVK